MQKQNYDVIVIGGGPGGYVAAIRASQLGMRVALVESDALGGICLNWGCIPSKSLLRNAEILNLFHRADEFGVYFDHMRYDFGVAISRSRDVVTRLNKGIQSLLKKNHVYYVEGYGSLLDSHRVAVNQGTTILEGQHIIIATGGHQKQISGLDIDRERVITSREALILEEIPESVVIVGGGATGVEFSYLYRSYGSEVTLVEIADKLLPNEDSEISQQLERSFKKQGIKLFTGSKASIEERISSELAGNADGHEITVLIEAPGGSHRVECQKVLVATGIQGNTTGFGLEHLGVIIEKGFIKVDECMRTNVQGIFAVGDVTGELALAHVAQAQAIVAAETIAGKPTNTLNYLNMPRATYCQPQVTSFGYTEEQASKLDYPVKIGRFPFRANGKSLASGETEGLAKLVIRSDTGAIIGAHLIGAEVTEMLPEILITTLLDGGMNELAGLVHAHPTLSETIKEAALAADGIAIHI